MDLFEQKQEKSTTHRLIKQICLYHSSYDETVYI